MVRTVSICIIVAVSTIGAAMVDPAIDDANGQMVLPGQVDDGYRGAVRARTGPGDL